MLLIRVVLQVDEPGQAEGDFGSAVVTGFSDVIPGFAFDEVPTTIDGGVLVQAGSLEVLDTGVAGWGDLWGHRYLWNQKKAARPMKTRLPFFPQGSFAFFAENPYFPLHQPPSSVLWLNQMRPFFSKRRISH